MTSATRASFLFALGAARAAVVRAHEACDALTKLSTHPSLHDVANSAAELIAELEFASVLELDGSISEIIARRGMRD